MTSLALQLLAGLFTLGLGVVALATSRYPEAHGERGVGQWGLVGAAFILSGVNETIQSIWAYFAYAAGPGSALWDGFLRWAPAANQSRSGLELGMYAALILLLVRPPARFPASRVGLLASGVVVAGMSLGALLGYFEPTADAPMHLTMVAMVNMGVAAGALAVLIISLLVQSLDRYLWVIIAIHALKSVLNVLWLNALVWLYTPEAWAPNPLQLLMIAAAIGAMMVAVAINRLRLARRGVYVRALLEPKPAPKYSSFG
jgi:hypothetical protein